MGRSRYFDRALLTSGLPRRGSTTHAPDGPFMIGASITRNPPSAKKRRSALFNQPVTLPYCRSRAAGNALFKLRDRPGIEPQKARLSVPVAD